VEAKELAEQVKELGKFKEQVESLKKFVMDNLQSWSKVMAADLFHILGFPT
jgi:catalase (peroxidase I)